MKQEFKIPFIVITTILLVSYIIYYIITTIQRKKEIKKCRNVLMKIFKNTKKRFENNGQQKTIPNIDHIYCITMPERRNYAMRSLGVLNTNITYFDAIKPKDLTKEDYKTLSETFNPSNKLMYRKMTKLPVHLSYTMCFIDALRKGYKTIIIFEDDIIVNIQKEILIDSIQEFLNEEKFIMFYMGYCWANCKQKFESTKYEYIVNVPNKTLFCNHAIVFKMEYIPDLLDYLYPMTNYSDDMFVGFFKYNNYDICVPKIPYFNQNRDQLPSLNENEDPNLPFCNLLKV